jgi:cytochrome c oxidase subunit III
MSTAATLDVSRLPVYASGSRALLWWGMFLLVTIESVVFATFIASYLFLRFVAPEWPPAGIAPPELLLPTINTIILIASSAAVYWGDNGIKKGDVMRLKLGVGAAALFSALFLVLKVVEYSDVKYYWDSHAYGSIIWTMIVFHSAHVGSVLLKGLIVLVLAFRGHFDAERHLGAQINGLYWHFVVGIWIPLYFTIYWVPRL